MDTPTAPDPNKVLIYDKNCPLCRWYTGEFVRMGILAPEGRICFDEVKNLPESACMDKDRAFSEIPLIDRKTQHTRYGLDSLVYLIARRFPWVNRWMQIPWIYGFFKRLYLLVSYNRRVIAASATDSEARSTDPGLNRTYASTFLAIALSVTVLLAFGFAQDLAFFTGLFGADHTPLQWLVAMVLGWGLHAAMALGVAPGRGWEYIRHLAVIALLGACAWIPGMCLTSLLGPNSLVISLSMVASFAIMAYQYELRSRAMHLSRGWIWMWLFTAFGGTAVTIFCMSY